MEEIDEEQNPFSIHQTESIDQELKKLQDK